MLCVWCYLFGGLNSCLYSGGWPVGWWLGGFGWLLGWCCCSVWFFWWMWVVYDALGVLDCMVDLCIWVLSFVFVDCVYMTLTCVLWCL